MFKASSFSVLAYLGILFLSVSALPPWAHSWQHGAIHPGYWPHRPNRPTWGHDRDYRPVPETVIRPGYEPDQQDYDDEDEQSGYFGCSCFLYVENTMVFRREDTDQRRYSCTGYGLRRCSRYCDELFQNEGLRSSSEQEACDVLGREVYTSWYRKNQVCGRNGPQIDIPMETGLCCRRGRPSLSCGAEQTS
ncbi:uncharacterized protein LOC129981642 [Argiope bruennichi]|uniref:Uncharacterized protein n=1 Tax=Argiope bruennichi TaxID=94029 RepID=A0A8T0G1S2_ARGBR|nr:uncharacterized protein LOC129981642 [Argiope bruennichi]KAF8797151.1 hypothetical protein HNY73_001448 [Argiope bruennichi]